MSARSPETPKQPARPEWMQESSEALKSLKADIEASSGIQELKKDLPGLEVDHTNINYALRYVQVKKLIQLEQSGKKIALDSNKTKFFENPDTLQSYLGTLVKALKNGASHLTEGEKKDYLTLQNVLIANKDLLSEAEEGVLDDYVRGKDEQGINYPVFLQDTEEKKPAPTEKRPDGRVVPAPQPKTTPTPEVENQEELPTVTKRRLELVDGQPKLGKIVIPEGYNALKPTEVVLYFQGYSSFDETMNTLVPLMKHTDDRNRIYVVPHMTNFPFRDSAHRERAEHGAWMSAQGSISNYLTSVLNTIAQSVELREDNYTVSIWGHSAGGEKIRSAIVRDHMHERFPVKNIRFIDGSYGTWASETAQAIKNNKDITLKNIYLSGSQTAADALRLSKEMREAVPVDPAKDFDQQHMDLRLNSFLH